MMERQRGAADECAEGGVGGLEGEKEALFSGVLMLQEESLFLCRFTSPFDAGLPPVCSHVAPPLYKLCGFLSMLLRPIVE